VPAVDATRFFYVHVMKTGGTTLVHNARANIPLDEVFPNSTELGAKLLQHMGVGPFLELPAEQRERTRWFSGHVTLAVAEDAFPDTRTVVLLRDPVERTLSYLRHCQQHHAEHRGLSLEEIYEDEWFFPRFIQDHQTKILSMTSAETWDGRPPELVARMQADPQLEAEITRQLEGDSPARLLLELTDRARTESVVVDDLRLGRAIDALDRIDVLALTTQLGELLDLFASAYGWRTSDRVLNATAPQDGSAALRRRIAADNAADLELYAAAQQRTSRGPRISRV